MATYSAWKFKTARFIVELQINELDSFEYDGEDESGEIQAKLDSGEFVAFESLVTVRLKNGLLCGSDSLVGSVYAREDVKDFWTAHRDSDPLKRNCSIMKAARGANCSIGHYFPDMVSLAISEARETLDNLPAMRKAR